MKSAKKEVGIIFLLALLLLLAASCTAPEKQFSRLISKYPHLIRNTDTTIYDTVIVKGFYLDTVRSFKKTDTVIITRYGVETKIFHHYNTDSIRVIQTQLPDTVVKKITIPGKTIVIKEQEGKQVVWLSWAILIVLFLLLIKNFFSRGK